MLFWTRDGSAVLNYDITGMIPLLGQVPIGCINVKCIYDVVIYPYNLADIKGCPLEVAQGPSCTISQQTQFPIYYDIKLELDCGHMDNIFS